LNSNIIKNKTITLFNKYKHGIAFIYFFFYIIWFNALEKAVTTNFTPMYHWLDDYIPFNEWFMIPYLLWFLYILITFMYFFFESKTEFYQSCAYLFIGMTICLTIYTLWPNGHHLRVDLDSLGRNNIFIELVRRLYTMDTPTNVSPSIHVFNSVGAYIAIYKNKKLQKIKWLQLFTFILTVLICMSTVFLKQHSIVDVFYALILNIVMYALVYYPTWQKQSEHKTATRSI